MDSSPLEERNFRKSERSHPSLDNLLESFDRNRRFVNRVAVVTGGSRGIGYAVSERVVAEGGQVVITGRNADSLSDAVKRLGPNAIGIVGEADDGQHQFDVIQQARERFGHIDILINNAGLNNSPLMPLLEMDFEAMRQIFEVNVFAMLGWTRAAVSQCMGDEGGSIVNIASIAGLLYSRGIGGYGASKAAMIYLTSQLAAELGPRVRVNAVAPAIIRTDFAAPLLGGDLEQQAISRYPAGRLGEVDDVASGVTYLASDEASWVTGHTLVIDGGIQTYSGV